MTPSSAASRFGRSPRSRCERDSRISTMGSPVGRSMARTRQRSLTQMYASSFAAQATHALMSSPCRGGSLSATGSSGLSRRSPSNGKLGQETKSGSLLGVSGTRPTLAEPFAAVVPRVVGPPPDRVAPRLETELDIERSTLIGRGQRHDVVRVRPQDRQHDRPRDAMAAVLGEGRHLVHAEARTVVVRVRRAGRYPAAVPDPDPPPFDAPNPRGLDATPEVVVARRRWEDGHHDLFPDREDVLVHGDRDVDSGRRRAPRKSPARPLGREASRRPPHHGHPEPWLEPLAGPVERPPAGFAPT